MNEFPNTASHEAPDKAQLASRLSAFSLASGLVLCCPLAGIAAVLTGGLALFIGRDAHIDRSWRRYAWGGVGLGVLGVVLGVVGAILFNQVNSRWEREGRVLFSGPNNALYALFNGDSDAFLQEFTTPGADATPAVMEDLKDRLTTHCGVFISCKAPEIIVIDGSGPWTLDGYEARFSSLDQGEKASVYPCRIMVKRLPSGTLRLVWMEIPADQVMIRYPAESQEARQGD